MRNITMPSKEDLQNSIEKIVDNVIVADNEKIEIYVDKLREQNLGINSDDLAKKILNRKSLKNGLVGAITGVGGFATLPVTVPADLIGSWRVQIALALSIAYTYGHTSKTTDLKTDVLIILAGDSAKEALKRFGIEATKSITKRLINKYITKDIMLKIWKVVGQKIITKAGQKSLTSFTKMIPLVGAPIGFAFDWAATQAVGRFSIKYYKG